MLGQICSFGTLDSYLSQAYVLPSPTVTTLFCKAAIADCCRAAQLSPSSSAAVEVVNQLGHWGDFDCISLFFQGFQGCLRDGGVACSAGLIDRVHFWRSAGRSFAQVSIKMKCKQLLSSLNQAGLDDLKLPLACHRLHHTWHSCMTCIAMGVGSGAKFYRAASIARHVMHMLTSVTTLLSQYADHVVHPKCI